MGELNFGRLLRRTRQFGRRQAIKDLGTGHEVTYDEHLDRVGRLCSVIRGLGATPTDSVAVLAGASHVYIELWHACLAGAAVINPLNNRLALPELIYVLNDAGSSILFVDAAFAPLLAEIRDQLPALRTAVLIGTGDVPHDARYDDLMGATASADLPPDLPAEPDDDANAVLMYTGGTTGLPKGVVLAQKAVMLSVHRMQSAVDHASPRYLSFMPLFHIGSMATWAHFLPNGGATILLPAFDPGAVTAAIARERITALGGVPTMYALMLQHPDFEPSMLETLRLLWYGAAPMPPPLLSSLMEMYPELDFHQTYGMTESAAIVTALTCHDHRRGGEILNSVGRPMLGFDLEIRDPVSGEPAPRGAVGEIWLRSDSIMVEYWNKPEQTANSLVDGWYRSGDAGRVDEEGYVFMADRVKDMIISGGENVYSLEVENALNSHPAVTQVAVIGVPDDTWGERVHAVVVCDPGSVSETELQAYAGERIAGFKLPRSWTLREEPLPLSAAGKVLKRALREQFSSGADD